MRILVVDDKIEISRRLQRELQKEGHEVYYEISPLLVLEKLKKARRKSKPFDLLLLNIQMPEIDGLTLFSRIKEERLGVEAIILTGYHNEQMVIEAIRLGVKDYLNKPISLERLDASILRVHENRVEEANSNYQILVVDDEKELCERIRWELKKEGYQVAMAYDGEDCLDYFKKNTVDVLITDIKMPGINGLEMLEKCREIHNDFTSIVITGHGNHKAAIEALKLETFNYLKKPLSLEELITSVKKGVEQINIRRGSFALREDENEGTYRR